jgi:hypothetical protein
MRVLVWATTLGALVGSTHAGGPVASSFNPSLFAEQFPDKTLELVALASGGAQREVERGFESWISAAFFSPADYETLSSMAGFHESDPVLHFEAPAHAGAQAQAEAMAERGLAVPLDLEWDAVDLLPSPAVLAEMAVLERRYLVSDEDHRDEPLATGSLGLRGSTEDDAGMAVDGHEDR